ncbi:MAG: 1-deoxy-D-xylulose-5-phosphate synthase [Kiritimatiellia bacterium]
MDDFLDKVKSPEDVKSLGMEQLPDLASAIRKRIIATVGRNGGHLASNLGTVELTIALMRIFNPPEDRIIWDVGHQAYAWKLLTGRSDIFDTLRQYKGMSGFTKPGESEYDAFIAGHAGTSLSVALGFAVGRDQLHSGEAVVAVTGDASVSNGIALEAMNNIVDAGSKIIVVLNDNEMSISQNVGSLSRSLGALLTDVRYNRIKAAAEQAGHKLHMTFLRRVYHRIESAIKSLLLKNAFFEEFGLRYIGPIDGHDMRALENAFLSANEFKGPVVVHVATQKGRGYRPAEKAPSGWHGVGPFDPEKEMECRSGKGAAKNSYSETFGRFLCDFAEHDPSIIAITAAMSAGTGLHHFQKKFPGRFYDVGICEEHGAVFAAGLAARGFHPVFAVYSTFLQRAVDCVMHDIALQNLPVLLCVDRAGIVGNDGPTHHGVFDIPMLRCIPNLVIMQPADYSELKAMMRTALSYDGPAVIRYPRGGAVEVDMNQNVEKIAIGKAVIVTRPADGVSDVTWIWSYGDMLPVALECADKLTVGGEAAGVVNARFIKPVDAALLASQAEKSASRFVTVENGVLAGGFGSAVRETLAGMGFSIPVLSFGLKDSFVEQGRIDELLEDAGLTADAIVGELGLR